MEERQWVPTVRRCSWKAPDALYSHLRGFEKCACTGAGWLQALNAHKMHGYCMGLVGDGFPWSPAGQMPQLTMMNPHWRQPRGSALCGNTTCKQGLIRSYSKLTGYNLDLVDRSPLCKNCFWLVFWTHKVTILKKLWPVSMMSLFHGEIPSPEPRWFPHRHHSDWHSAFFSFITAHVKRKRQKHSKNTP